MKNAIARIVGTDADEPSLTLEQEHRTRISSVNAARAELVVLRATTAWDGEAAMSVRRAQDALEAATAALAASRQGTAVAMVNRALGTPEGFGVPMSEARAELQRAQDELEAAKDAKRYLEGQIPAAVDRLSSAEWRVSDIVKTVMLTRVRPLGAAYMAEHARIQRAAADDRQVYDWMHLRKLIDGSDPPFRIERHSAADAWKDWETALLTDPDAVMPALLGAE
jgi:hypothetical protein